MNQVLAGAALVAFLNVALNVSLNLAARSYTTLLPALTTWHFGLAFLFGCCSLLALLSLYAQAVELSSAMILMAALSLVIGSSVGVVIFGNRPDTFEIILLGMILLLLFYRWINVTKI